MKKISFLFFILFTFTEISLPTVRGKIKKGNKLFYEKKYEEATEQYRDAQIKKPNSEIINYNLGNALYKQENYNDAIAEYNRSLKLKNKDMKSKIYYNIGNTQYRLGNYDDAIKYYKKSLDLNPKDEDAKFNIQFILQKALKQNAAQKEQKQKEQKKEDKSKQERKEEKKKYMSKEDLERLLQMAQEQEKKAKKKQKIAIPKLPPVEEDW
ncbi:MAG: tetratricopeptide repeat protein [Elusimicrobiota bacterium]|nr:tetratricopeptide repeat protein [Elusimicrobiota bacterium]